MMKFLPERLQILFRDAQADLFDNRPTVQDVVFEVTGGQDLPKALNIELREEVLAALKKAGYEDSEETLRAYQYRPDLERFFE